LNDKKIDFCYKYTFITEGKYKLKIIFKKLLKNTSYMFYNCTSLTSLNLSNFDTDNVKDMTGMFYKCSSLSSLNLSNFNTDNVNNMSLMFLECSSLNSLDLSNFNTNNVSNLSVIFYKLNKNCNVITLDKNLLKYLQNFK